MVRAEALSAFQVDPPPGGGPEPILLIVDRHDPLGPPMFGEEGVEAIEGADLKQR